MASFVIEGGHRLCGEIHPQGAKNEVLQIICATLLTEEEVTVNNIPDILDVNNLIQLLREMGVTVAKKGIDTYSFKAENVDLAYQMCIRDRIVDEIRGYLHQTGKQAADKGRQPMETSVHCRQGCTD